MQEYVSDAVVLAKNELKDADSRVSLFTRKYGKISARAKSARKITSKLSAHLELGVFTRVRLVEKKGFQVVDALKRSKLAFQPPDMHFLDVILPEGEPEEYIWRLLTGENGESFNRRKILAVLGWDPVVASCNACDRNEVAAFHLKSQDFFCGACSLSGRFDGLLFTL